MPGIYLGKKLALKLMAAEHECCGDDINEIEDEDGIIFTSALKPGEDSLIDVTASSPGFLNAWMDLNRDGDWTDEGEKILSDLYWDVGSIMLPSMFLQRLSGRHIFPFPI